MYRATTPTHMFCFGEINPEDFKKILITYVQNDTIILEKTEADLTFGSEEVKEVTYYNASLKLSQEETNMFSGKSGVIITVQIRALDYEGNVMASNKIKISLQDVLNDEVLS